MSVKRPKDYLNNANLLEEIDKSKANLKRFHNLPKAEQDERAVECLTPELITMLITLVDKYATHYRWRGYTWIEDMRAEAMLNLCKVALKFDRAKAGAHPNPFAYYTQIITRVFLTYIEKEKKQGRIRDDLIEMSNTDMMPSFGRQGESDATQLEIDLDGTKSVVGDPKLRRRRPSRKKVKIDNTSEMTEAEYKRWLDNKVEEFKRNQKG